MHVSDKSKGVEFMCREGCSGQRPKQFRKFKFIVWFFDNDVNANQKLKNKYSDSFVKKLILLTVKKSTFVKFPPLIHKV